MKDQMVESLCKRNSVFEERWWLEIVAAGKFEEITASDKDGNICAKISCCVKNNRVYMPVLTQTCGIWIEEKNEQNYREKGEFQKEMLSQIVDKLGVYRSVNISLDTHNDYFLPFYWKNYIVSPRVSYRINDLTNLESVFSKFASGIKRDIKAAKKKLHISYKASAEVLFNIMEKTFEEQNRKYPISKEIIEKIVEESYTHGNGCMISAIDDEGNVHAAIFLLFDSERCYYLIGGKDAEYKSSNALTLLIWEGIQFAATVSKVFDFEGSMVEGIENFFRRFGPEQVVYYNVRKETIIEALWTLIKPYIKKVLGYK